MTALPHGGKLPVEWRRGHRVWAPETIALAKIYASEGQGIDRVSQSLARHGVAVGRETVKEWVHPEWRVR